MATKDEVIYTRYLVNLKKNEFPMLLFAAVLASQQAAAAVTVISPFQAGPPTK